MPIANEKATSASAAPGGEVQLVPAAIDRWRFTEAGRLLYSYRLDAGSWSSFEDRTVFSLQGIASGSHTLQVRAMDRNFNVGPAASHVFAVLAPWYRQPGLILIGGLAAAILVFSVRQHLNRHRELARLVESKTRQLASDFEERSRLQARFESILDHAPTLIYVKDLAGRYIVSSLRHREALGRTREEVIGRTDEEIFGAASGAFQPTELAALTENRVIQREDTDHRGPRPRTFLSITCPLYDSAGQPNAVCGISTDVTESKVLQERLQHSQRLEAIGMLAGGVAHDFNNLLTVINGYSQLALQAAAGGAPVEDCLSEVIKAGTRASELTQQLLAFGRKQVLQPQVVGLNHLVEETQRLLGRLIGEDIQLVLELDPAVRSIKADPAQMQTVIINLAVNARAATQVQVRLLRRPTRSWPPRRWSRWVSC